MLSQPLKTSSYLVSKSSLPVFLIDSLWSCAARWHDIWDYEAGRATLSVPVVWTTNIHLCQPQENKKGNHGKMSFLSHNARLKSTVLHPACWFRTLILGHLILQLKMQTHLIVTKEGRWQTRPTAITAIQPHMLHTQVVGWEAIIITEEPASLIGW